MKQTKIAILAGLALLAVACAAPTGTTNNYNNNTPSSGHDGTTAAPVTLTLGTPYSGKVGAYSTFSDSESYYQFNTGTNTAVMLSITGSSVPHPGTSSNDDYWIHLYSGAITGTALFYPTVIDGVSPIFSSLTTGTIHSIQLSNQLDAATTYQIKVEPVPATINEGTAGSPITVTLGAGRLSYTSNYLSGKSYYKFNTGSFTNVKIDYGIPALDSALYSNSDFASGIQSWDSSYSSSTNTATGLTINTDYYLEIDNGAAAKAKVNFTLTLTGS